VRGSKVLILGVSYKPAIGDVRESPALKIIERLRQRGADVRYHDPYVPELPRDGLTNTDLDAALADSELAVIVTAHPGLDYRAIATALPTVDLRGVIRHLGAATDINEHNPEGPLTMNGLMHVTESA
jgi:UDP-N-acetyl-D-glucosamine dehydrogenase